MAKGLVTLKWDRRNIICGNGTWVTDGTFLIRHWSSIVIKGKNKEEDAIFFNENDEPFALDTKGNVAEWKLDFARGLSPVSEGIIKRFIEDRELEDLIDTGLWWDFDEKTCVRILMGERSCEVYLIRKDFWKIVEHFNQVPKGSRNHPMILIAGFLKLEGFIAGVTKYQVDPCMFFKGQRQAILMFAEDFIGKYKGE